KLTLEFLQWFGFGGAALVWAAQHVIGFGATLARCGAGGVRFGIDLHTWELTTFIVALAFVLAAEASAIIVARRTWGVEHDGPALVAAVVALAQPQQNVVHPPRPPGASPTQWGAQLYAANCLSCHGPKGEGQLPNGPLGAGEVRGAGPSLRGVGALAADFYLRTGYMPLHSPYDQPQRGKVQFSEREIGALVAYVASLGHGPSVP